MKFGVFIILFLLVLSCSTEKNTLVNRSYHGMTAHYNGYFNANELINQALITYKDTRTEDYYSLLPLNPLPNEEEVKGMYPAIDTAIAKCTEVISKHSMPTASEPSKKRAEYNAWIDENWLTIGISNYYRRDYELAEKNFSYINKFFSNDPSNYTAAIWLARTNIEKNNLTEASLILKNIDKQIEELEASTGSASGKSKEKVKKKKGSSKKKKSKTADKEEEKAEFPKKQRFLFELTKADLSLKQDENDKAIESLEKSLEFCKKSADKARVHFILAQLNAEKKETQKAKYHFGKVLKYNAPFDMNFNARINRALMGGDAKIKKELEKMLRDDKNVEFKDQIYFALGDIAFKEGNKNSGIELTHKSILFSTKNTRQKAMSYEKLGDLSFSDRNYVVAQKYYDSCAKVLPETYPNAEAIRNKALKLKDLVFAVETAAYEDSVQKIAGMSADDRTKFAENLVEKIKADEKRKKEQEAIRLKEIQAQQAIVNESQSTTKFFWNNAKMKSEGLESFRKQWGARENEDDWRRSEKIAVASFKELESDSGDVVLEEPKEDSLTAESLLLNLPITDSLMQLSNERLVSSLYDAGIIYKDQLNESAFASKQFEAILERKFESKYNLLALFQLYKMNEFGDATKAYAYKNEILASYPNSDYANFLRDPDYFIKKKEFEKLAENDYIKVLDRYNKGLYSLVISTAEPIVENELDNPYRSKYMLLRAMSVGQTTENKSKMIPPLKQIIAEYPGTSEEKKAKELIEIIEKGYTAFVESNFANKSIYSFDENADHWVIILLEKDQTTAASKTKVVDFNKELYGKNKLNVSSKIYGKDQNVIVIKEFDETKASEYIRTFKRTKKNVQSLHESKIFSISQDNLKILFETQKLGEYEMFYAEFY
ncbi:MAG: hypothetical protein V4622_04865 [Bacteroidota bacterium]